MPRAWPDAPTNAEVDATVLESQDSPVVCRVVSAHTYTDPEQADADRPAHVLACDMCETQALVGAAICSKCGRGLFLVAQHVNLQDENRAWHRHMRDTMQDYHASDQEIPRVRATFAHDRHRLLAARRTVPPTPLPGASLATLGYAIDTPMSHPLDQHPSAQGVGQGREERPEGASSRASEAEHVLMSTPSAIPRGVSPPTSNSPGSSRHGVEDVLSAAPPAHQERLP